MFPSLMATLAPPNPTREKETKYLWVIGHHGCTQPLLCDSTAHEAVLTHFFLDLKIHQYFSGNN